ncbi:response regulator [Prauserella muralis]|uniref:DNA-binding response regulator n=1 Tax=Prauserella muralis TaxID=588067 RepID=A0A2V4ARK9_9PSEU|nr:response regulator transcription factor [Prauserella muralis]PXY22161.1 DNA-binding response regulator [Prauserella muralis]TWE27763.1 LuxR family two component transcriptional regulator [Prauserella muralis]
MNGQAPDGGIGVLVVDDHAVVRRGLTAFLDTMPGIHVVGEASDGADALDRLARLAAELRLPQVVLMDMLMPRMDGITAIGAVRERHPGLAVVVLTSFGETERVQSALRAGAAGYLLKDAEPDEIAAAVRAAARGEVHLDPAVAGRLARQLSSPASGLAALTTRERSILVLVAEGMSNRQIAGELGISERTARTHVSHVLAKLGLSSRTQAALVAVREGLLPPVT